MPGTGYEEKADEYCLDFVRKELRGMGEVSFNTATDSMSPFIKPGDRVVVQGCTLNDLKPGDIVLFRRNAALFVHRCIRKQIMGNDVILVPKADNAFVSEDPVAGEQFLGKVVKIMRGSRTVHLTNLRGGAVNACFYALSLFKMEAYLLARVVKRRFTRGVRIEDRMIRLCSSAHLDDESCVRIQEIWTQHIDWDYVLRKIRNEDTASLIYRTLEKMQGVEGRIPAYVRNALRDSYYSVSAQNISLLQSFEDITLSLQAEGIEVIVFKGVMLAESVYRDIGLRPMGDVDILVKGDDLARADLVLRRHGLSPPLDVSNFEDIVAGQYRNSILYRSEAPASCAVHVHWHILNFTPFHESVLQRIDMEKIWRESVTLPVGKAEMLTFALHHQLIYLCMHALNHSFFPLLRLCDINEFLRAEKGRITWDRVIEDARAFNLSKHVYYVLYLLSGMFSTDVPRYVLDALRPQKIGLIERTFLSSVLRGTPILTGEWLLCLGLNETLKDGLLFLRRLVFPPQKELALIRKRDVAAISVMDYVKRLTAGLHCMLKVICLFSKRAAFRL